MQQYAKVLAMSDRINKTVPLLLTYLAGSNPLRKGLITAYNSNREASYTKAGNETWNDPLAFYTAIAGAYMVVSPMGDRADCYRQVVGRGRGKGGGR